MLQYLTVTALTKYIKAKLEGDKHLFSILLKGEVSNFKRHSRGHLYFTLKDEGAQISAIMFSRDADKLKFSPKEGDHVLVSGRISLYEPSGSYAIQVTEMKPDGVGELYLKYEALKKDLEAKGYFLDSHKKPIPKFPKAIGVITSPTGAVIEDIKHTITRRYLLTEIHLYPALVQGPGSIDSIRNQILLANEKMSVDVLIVGRGGGSIEDLWAFNEMGVIDAIYHSKIPIITAIGHETDYTISDLVSDLRAPTPTAAAELATPNRSDLMAKLSEYESAISYKIKQYMEVKKTELLYLDQRLDRQAPIQKLEQSKKEIDRMKYQLHQNYAYHLEYKKLLIEHRAKQLKHPQDLIDRLKDTHHMLQDKLSQHIDYMLQRKMYQFDVLKATLSNLNPLLMMDKGFALIKKDDQVITTMDQINVNDTLNIHLKDGHVETKVLKKVGK